MLIDHRKLGQLEFDENRVITMEEGVPGFSDARKYVLIEVKEGSAFRWLASVDHPELAFVVADPFAFFSEYQAPLDDRELNSLKFEENDELAVLTVVSIRGRRREDTTFNLRAPLVLNMRTLRGRQFVLKDDKWGIRVPMPAAARTGAAGATQVAENAG